MLNLQTLNDIFFIIAASRRERAMLVQDSAGAWHPVSSSQVYQPRARRRSSAPLLGHPQRRPRRHPLRESLGVGRRRFRLARHRRRRRAHLPHAPRRQIALLLADSGARVVFVSTRAQYEKVAHCRSATALEHIVLMDEDRLPGCRNSFPP